MALSLHISKLRKNEKMNSFLCFRLHSYVNESQTSSWCPIPFHGNPYQSKPISYQHEPDLPMYGWLSWVGAFLGYPYQLSLSQLDAQNFEPCWWSLVLHEWHLFYDKSNIIASISSSLGGCCLFRTINWKETQSSLTNKKYVEPAHVPSANANTPKYERSVPPRISNTCNYCMKKGHLKWDCPIWPKGPSNKSNWYSNVHGPGHHSSSTPTQPMQQYHSQPYAANTTDAANTYDIESSLSAICISDIVHNWWENAAIISCFWFWFFYGSITISFWVCSDYLQFIRYKSYCMDFIFFLS